MDPLRRGREAQITSAQDLSPHSFRRLVARRARQLIDPSLKAVRDEDRRRKLEDQISQHFEKIHQGADFLPARFLSDGAERARAVCRIVCRDGYGTGFLIARGYLMTNNHVLESAESSEGCVAEFGFEDGHDVVRVAILPERFFLTDPALDFSIVACDDAPLQDIQPIRLRRSPASVTRGEKVNVIQHPRGRPKEVALHNNDVTRVKDSVIHYQTDTEPGSSGSPVFNNSWELVALHHAGWEEPGSNGAATNEGVRIASIVSFLESKGPKLAPDPAALAAVLETVEDTSPYLGLFDVHGLTDPREIEVPDFAGSSTFADVGFWNIEHFNNEINDSRIAQVSDVVARLSMDALGLVEVEGEALDRLCEVLGRRGSAYEYVIHDVQGSQDLAVLYDADTTEVKLRKDLARRPSIQRALAARTGTGLSAFPRTPLFAEVSVGIDGQAVSFLMIVVHLKAFADAASRARRRLAAKHLAEIVEELRTSEGLPVVLGGDFNELLTTDVLDPLKSSPDLFALTADDATSGAISYVGASHRSMIDHVIVTRDVKLGDVSGDDAAIVRLDKSLKGYVQKISDHVPVVFRMVPRKKPIELGGAPGGAAGAAPSGRAPRRARGEDGRGDGPAPPQAQ